MSSDYTSSAAEDSCDTVIYMGNNGQMSDRDLSDNERPPSPKTFKAMQLKLTSSSEDETSEPLKKSSFVDLKVIVKDKTTKCREGERYDKYTVDDEGSTDLQNNNNDNNNNNLEYVADSIPSVIPDHINHEKVVNIVLPLVIKEKLNSESDFTTSLSPSSESEKSKTSLVDQIIENESNNQVILIPETNENENERNIAPSEKELRRREKRISKLLKETMSDEVPALVSINNKKNTGKHSSGYTSDNAVGSLCKMHTKQDGYISAPENNRCKPVQVVKGIVRQSSVESSVEQQARKLDVHKNRELLKNWVQNELMKHLREMESMKSSLESMSNSIAMGENSTDKIVEVIEPSGNDNNSSDHLIETNVDNISPSTFSAEGTSVDDTENSIRFTVTVNSNDNTLLAPLGCISTSVDPPSVDPPSVGSMFSNSINNNIIPKTESTETIFIEPMHVKPFTEKVEVRGCTTTFGIEPEVYSSDELSIVSIDKENNDGNNFNDYNIDKDNIDGSISNAYNVDKEDNEDNISDGYSIDHENIDANISNDYSVDKETNDGNISNDYSTDSTLENEEISPKIQNLNHVITVSAIPNFTVATKEPLLNQLISSPQVQRNSTRTANIANTKYYKGSNNSVNDEWTSRPIFERSYSKEDTCSLVSVNESDAYDSDSYSSSYPLYNHSPALEIRQHNRPPTRLKYRWSTVFEEEEKKKEKTLKHAGSGKNKTEYLNDDDLKNISFDTPKSLRFSRSPKKEKGRRTQSVDGCPQTPQSSSKCSNPSPKGHKRFQLLSPRSDRRMKDTNSDNKRNSGCSDASSGIGSSSSQSQSSSLHSNEDILTGDITVEKESPGKYKYWPFG